MFEIITTKLRRHRNKVIILLLALTILDVLIFYQIFVLEKEPKDLRIYFFDVGQGDSGFVELPGDVQVLIDGGPPNGRLLENLAKVLPPTDRYIDLVILSHPQLDHFGGLIEVMKRYRIGAFLTNGREGSAKAFQDLERVIQKNNIRTIMLEAGDRIRYQENSFHVLSPAPQFIESKELNDTSLVLELESKNSKTLFTGDIGKKIETALVKAYSEDIDILKVAHHGSKFSSTAQFLKAVRPELAVIGVGKNSYGHPTKEALDRLKTVGAKIFRTDKDGTIKLLIDGQSIKIFKKF